MVFSALSPYTPIFERRRTVPGSHFRFAFLCRRFSDGDRRRLAVAGKQIRGPGAAVTWPRDRQHS